MLTGNSHHLTYCANIHPAESWEEALLQLKNHIPKIKQVVSPESKFGVGLYLSDKASREILVGSHLNKFKSWLNKEGLYVFTMNGFPYGGFHGNVVKDNVYKPDWTTRERMEYTKRLFNILASLVPDGIDGGVSTLPISYKYWFDSKSKAEKARDDSCKHFVEIALFLKEIESRTGKHLHLDIEPEPDCFIENSDEVIEFFMRLSKAGNETVLKRHIAVCYDICHFSVKYEEPESVFQKLISNGIRIGKIQISAALKATFSSENSDKQQIVNQFKQFNEARYLHQTGVRSDSNEYTSFRDLSFAIEFFNQNVREWRTHFHVPLFIEKYGSLLSTQDDVLKVLHFLRKNHITNHLEVETYSWDVLPANFKADMTNSIIRELEWVKKNLRAE